MNDPVNLMVKDNFQFWTDVTIRFSDQDPLGHINNVAYAAYIEAGRTMFLGSLLNSEQHASIDFILANVNIDYVKEAYYPGIINVGTRVIRLGTKSITTGYGLFLKDSCLATSQSTNVFFDTTKRCTVEIPDDVRKALVNDPLQGSQPAVYTRNY
ncbi:MAG: acyl-CoA thioesterase [Cycloclasticus sp.]|nr:acyl-CoA thioesterase [Cycloclasticus sp.]